MRFSLILTNECQLYCMHKPRRSCNNQIVGFINAHISLQQQSQPTVDHSSDNVDFATKCILMKIRDFDSKFSMYCFNFSEIWYSFTQYITANNNVSINFRMQNFQNLNICDFNVKLLLDKVLLKANIKWFIKYNKEVCIILMT